MRKFKENMIGSMQGRAFIRPDRLELALLAGSSISVLYKATTPCHLRRIIGQWAAV